MIEKVKAEIERLKREELTRNDIGAITGKHFVIDADVLLSFIESLEKEQDVKFETEYVKFSNDVDADNPLPIDLADYKDFARHFYELGKNTK